MDNYKWRLTWCGMQDSQMLRAAVEKCGDFPLFRDSDAHLITYDEYIELLVGGEIEPAQSYWQISAGQVGLVSLRHYAQYRDTWDAISTCKSDFSDGWWKCEKYLQMLADWDSAVREDRARRRKK